MRRYTFAISLLASVLLVQPACAHLSGYYAREAEPIWDRMKVVRTDPGGYLHSRLTLRASPGVPMVTARYDETREGDGRVLLTIRDPVARGTVAIGPGIGSELLRSPDRRVFAVTTSDGGANGPYRALVIHREGERWTATDLTPLIAHAFGHPVRCGWPEVPNVAALRWQAGGRRLIVAAEIVAHSNCDSFGTFRTYTVDWRRGRIVASHGQLAAKALYRASLGPELRAAPDRCIRHPRRCWVWTNHDPRHRP